MKVFRRGTSPKLVATIPVGELPHGLWPSGDGSRVYVAFENGGVAAAIDTLTNKVIATIPIGQTTQALVYLPNAIPDGVGTEQLAPPGEAAKVARLSLEPEGTTLPGAHASAAVNSLGLLDLVELAAAGLDSDHWPSGNERISEWGRRGKKQVWFLSEQLVDTPLVKAD